MLEYKSKCDDGIKYYYTNDNCTSVRSLLHWFTSNIVMSSVWNKDSKVCAELYSGREKNDIVIIDCLLRSINKMEVFDRFVSDNKVEYMYYVGSRLGESMSIGVDLWNLRIFIKVLDLECSDGCVENLANYLHL